MNPNLLFMIQKVLQKFCYMSLQFLSISQKVLPQIPIVLA